MPQTKITPGWYPNMHNAVGFHIGIGELCVVAYNVRPLVGVLQ